MTEPPNNDDAAHPDPNEAWNEWLRQFGIPVPPGGFNLQAMLAQMQQAMQAGRFGPASASGVNWAQAKAAARRVVASQGPDPTPSQRAQRELADADRLAELWLDQATTFPQLSLTAVCWSRADWVEHTMDAWRTVVEPIVTSIADALAGMLGQESEEASAPPELAALSAMLTPLLRQAAGSMYGLQVASAIGTLASQVVSGSDIGLQLLDTPRVVLVPGNLSVFSEGLEVSQEDVLLWLVLRESARQRLFTQVGWLGPQLLAMLEHYAREITIDTSAISSALDLDDISELTPQKLAEVSAQLQGRLFSPSRTPEQEQILVRLETSLALIEGWVDVVTEQAAQPWLPDAAALAEAVRRRRAAGGPAEKLFRTLVGLELRPRRVRDAANLWAALQQARGITARDATWAHPDFMPTTQDLDDPLGFVAGENRGSTPDEWDKDLARLLNDQNPPDQHPHDGEAS